MKNKKGFTLVELVVVIAIIGILIGIMVPSLFVYVTKQKEKNAKVEASAYSIAIQAIFDMNSISTGEKGFDLDDILLELLGSKGDINLKEKKIISKKALDTGSKLDYFYSYSNNSFYCVNKDKELTECVEEEVLFPNKWQVNEYLLTQYYGYFTEFTRYKYVDKDNAEYYGYLVSYDKKDRIQYIDGIKEAGVYDDNNKLVKSWDDMKKEGNADESEGEHICNKINMSAYSSATQIILPSTIGKISSPLENNTKVKKVFIHDSIKELTNGFRGCSSLEFIRLPKDKEPGEKYNEWDNSTSKYHDGSGFEGTTNLHYINFPENVSKLGNHAFQNSGIRNIIMPQGVTELNNNPFDGANELECITLAKGFKTLGNTGRFTNCAKLRSIYIGKGIANVEENVFSNCTSLTSLYFQGSIKRWRGEEDDNGLKEALDKCPNKNNLTVHLYCASNPLDKKEEREYLTTPSENSYRYSFWNYSGFMMKEWNTAKALGL